MISGNDLRTQYLQFFQAKDSLIVPSSSLVPTDPTTLLTSAGMQPLVPYFKGEETPPSPRLTSCQKCCRADDIEQVGVTWRHASFFEMLGNFSFGDYFKREAIIYAWEFLTKTLNIDPQLLWVSVYEDDDEAPQFWKNDVGLSDERIFRFDKKDNWWGPVGKSGPCGPDSEIFLDRGAKYDTGDPEMDRPGGDGDRYGELWNLVFQQYNQREDGTLEALPAPGIDTGMGLERTAAILQGVDTIHQTDLFAPIINATLACARSGELPFSTSPLELNPQDPTTKPLKIIADHLRAAVFMASDGITPGNNGRDYMMRRFIRRAFLQGRALDLRAPFLHRLVPIVARGYGDVYPEIAQRRDLISDLIRREEERFGDTIESGTNRLEDLIRAQTGKGERTLPGAEVFRLYETFGFPRELTAEVALESGLSIDESGYDIAAEEHSRISGSGVGAYEKRDFAGLETQFVGYDTLRCEATIVSVKRDGDETQVVLNRSPLYAESGGQVGDTGAIDGPNFYAEVVDTKKQGKAWVHTVRLNSHVKPEELRDGAEVQVWVDDKRRHAIERAHSATHLLHAALRENLGRHVEQRGSLVEADRLRFDFVHFAPLTPQEIRQIEWDVNERILASIPVVIRQMSQSEARREGAMALFGEKYGDIVRTVRMGDFSFELCGGTHSPITSAVGQLRIISESGVGANLRRIEALTGERAWEYGHTQSDLIEETCKDLGIRPNQLLTTTRSLKDRNRELERQLELAQREKAGSASDQMLQDAQEISGLKLVSTRAPEGLNANALRELADKLSDKLQGVVVLAGQAEGKVLWAVKAHKMAVEKGAHAGNLVRELAKMTGGGGGGRPDFAQAGGRDASQIEAALARVSELLGAQLQS